MSREAGPAGPVAADPAAPTARPEAARHSRPSRTFLALLARDAHVARRRLALLLLQNLLQPLMFVFVFGKVMVSSGFMPVEYQSLLLPGIIAVSMMISGIQGVALQLITDFQYTREIEDRLLAPIPIEGVALEKIVAGMIQALVAGLVAIPFAWLIMGSGVDVDPGGWATFAVLALLVALFASASGLVLGCTIDQAQIGLMFTIVVAPLIFFGCVYYPWTALEPFPVLQWAVLVNPLVYASEGFRGALVPQFEHLSLAAIFAALTVANVALVWLGFRQFRKRAIG